MNHSFKLNITSGLCNECNRNIIEHSDSAQCEACPNVGSCDVLNGMLLCESCYEHDKELARQDSPVPSNDRDTRITQLVNAIGREIPLDARAYFVTEITSIVDIERKLLEIGGNDTQYELAAIIETRLIKQRANIRELQKLEVEARTSAITDQKYLNQIVPQLREEERAKFAAYDITYKPHVASVSPGVSKPRVSAADKAIESMAKMLGISVEQARISLQSATKNVLKVDCTCREIPGMCKVHVKD